jgi:hypothetical protein
MAKMKHNQLNLPAVRIITAMVITNGGAELMESYGFTQEQVMAWTEATARRITAQATKATEIIEAAAQMAGVEEPQ